MKDYQVVALILFVLIYINLKQNIQKKTETQNTLSNIIIVIIIIVYYFILRSKLSKFSSDLILVISLLILLLIKYINNKYIQV